MAANFAPENHLNKQVSRWFAVYTRYKREKLVAKALEQKGISYYLPIQKVHRQWERKKRIVELPLINCYVFVKITEQEYVPVLSTEHVVKFVQFSRNLISIPEKEILLLKKILLEEIPVQTTNLTFESGDSVEITKGSLVGLKGKLIRPQGKYNFLVALETIGCLLQMEVDSSFLKKN